MPEPENEAVANKESDEPGMLQIIILILSVYVLIVFAIQTFVRDLSPETNEILDGMDLVVCVFFLWDFFFRLWKAPSKLEFMKWGWIDFISSIPILFLPASNHIRLLRIIRMFRILRAFRSTKIIAHFLFRHRARTGVISVILVSFLVAVFSAIAVLNFETFSPDSNIKTSEDALWWSFSTITTVSCEKYPVTEGGRAVALFLMATGVCLFGCITAYIATVFLEPMQKMQKEEDSELKLVLEEMKLLREKVEALETSNQQVLSQKE
ncbi:MAG: ion transporter [Methylacidiphilales bacterium]|nr:ion transporter [Candidatus Methylacidiphilales bacterium]